jgi:hypothetical protein
LAAEPCLIAFRSTSNRAATTVALSDAKVSPTPSSNGVNLVGVV